jgi:hypothetical protein
MSNMTRKIVSLAATFAIAAAVALPAVTFAQTANDPYGVNAVDPQNSGLSLGAGGGDIRSTAARLINVALGFLGIIAVIIVLIGGFKYMLSGGDQSKTEDARKLIVSGIIGLAIILSAWAITSFVMSRLVEAAA